MLGCESGIGAAGPDVHQVEGSACHGGKNQRGAKDLASPFPTTSIDSDHRLFIFSTFHA
jgi:hypothetical protein